MASYTYTGDTVREFPTLVLTLKPGDTFDAPDNFLASDVVPANGKKTAPVTPTPTPTPEPSAEPDTIQGDE